MYFPNLLPSILTTDSLKRRYDPKVFQLMKLNVFAWFQGQNPNPWNVMTLMDYDYKTNMMTCVVPKSDAMVFHPDVFFVPVLPGCLSHMAPTYRWTAFVLAGVDVSRSNMHCKLQIEDQNQMGVKLVMVLRVYCSAIFWLLKSMMKSRYLILN